MKQFNFAQKLKQLYIFGEPFFFLFFFSKVVNLDWERGEMVTAVKNNFLQ
jgi:hypothetical protein